MNKFLKFIFYFLSNMREGLRPIEIDLQKNSHYKGTVENNTSSDPYLTTNSAQISVFEKSYQIGFAGFLKRGQRRRLES